MELSSKELADKVVVKARENGFLINAIADKVLRFVPPLIVERRHIDRLIKVLDKILGKVEQ
jgi:4-aminobutyrate aminotransferase-like enzyme